MVLNVEPYDDENFGWHCEPPYDFYDTDADPFEDTSKVRAIRGGDGRIEAFWSFDLPEDGVVEIGIGLRPDVLGRGLGERYLRAQLDYAREHRQPHRFRLYVASWNERAIRRHEFMRMERDA